MAFYPVIDKEQAQNAVNAFIYQIIFETPEQKRDRTEREKVYELQRLNENIESQRRCAYSPWYSTWKSEPVKKWKSDKTLVYFMIFEVALFLSVLALFVYALINVGGC